MVARRRLPDLVEERMGIAACPETGAPSAGIMVSRAVRKATQSLLKATLHPLGELTLKTSIGHPCFPSGN